MSERKPAARIICHASARFDEITGRPIRRSASSAMDATRRLVQATKTASVVAIVATSALLPVDTVFAQDAVGEWPQWRGVHRDGTAPDTGLLHTWAEGGPPLLFSMAGAGGGVASIAVTADRILTMGDHGDEQFVLAFDRSTGDPLWRTAIGPAWLDGLGGPRHAHGG